MNRNELSALTSIAIPNSRVSETTPGRVVMANSGTTYGLTDADAAWLRDCWSAFSDNTIPAPTDDDPFADYRALRRFALREGLLGSLPSAVLTGRRSDTTLCDFERRTLRRIAAGDLPEDPGAAWWAACEALAGRGLIKAGKVTAKGHTVLIAQKEPSDG